MIDLHCHSIFSDGEHSPAELLKKAENLGLTYFSITDHNNCFAYENIDQTVFSGRLIPGVEIVTSFETHIIEVLGYGIDIKKINEWVVKNKNKELEFAKTIYPKLTQIFDKEKIKYTKNVNYEEIVKDDDPTGKIKQYIYNDLLKYEENQNIIKEDILLTYANFNKKGLNNPNSNFFISEYIRFPSINETIDLIHKSGGLSFIAHIYQYNVENHIDFLEKIRNQVNLDGIETYHSSFSKEQTKQINDYADKNNLYKSGGSDYHGKLKPGIKLGLNLEIEDEIITPWINKIK